MLDGPNVHVYMDMMFDLCMSVRYAPGHRMSIFVSPRWGMVMEQNADQKMNLKLSASLIGVSPHTLRAWTRQRRIPFYRCGRRLVFARKDLESFLAECRVMSRQRVEG